MYVLWAFKINVTFHLSFHISNYNGLICTLEVNYYQGTEKYQIFSQAYRDEF